QNSIAVTNYGCYRELIPRPSGAGSFIKYKEKVVNASNKKDVIKAQEQALSEHQGYGSAKFKK
ncbi:MAG: hypothetical protein COU34_05030, partial [Candidatus Magasanikbacteria bacterium CG10_big_fil_rev_8_21_14_0_10_43_9]